MIGHRLWMKQRTKLSKASLAQNQKKTLTRFIMLQTQGAAEQVERF